MNVVNQQLARMAGHHRREEVSRSPVATQPAGPRLSPATCAPLPLANTHTSDRGVQSGMGALQRVTAWMREVRAGPHFAAIGLASSRRHALARCSAVLLAPRVQAPVVVDPPHPRATSGGQRCLQGGNMTRGVVHDGWRLLKEVSSIPVLQRRQAHLVRGRVELKPAIVCVDVRGL